jgi:hypothetical protein
MLLSDARIEHDDSCGIVRWGFDTISIDHLTLVIARETVGSCVRGACHAIHVGGELSDVKQDLPREPYEVNVALRRREGHWVRTVWVTELSKGVDHAANACAVLVGGERPPSVQSSTQ